MKIVIDLQGLQTQSRRRGIGRCTRDLVHAFLDAAAPHHQVHLTLAAPLEETTDAVIAEFRQRLPRARIHYLRLPFDTSQYLPGNQWRRAAASRLMRLQLDALQADWVWHSSVFEGYDEDAVVPDAALSHAATAATLYDLIPLHDPDTLLSNAHMRRWYEANLAFVRRTDLLLSISEYTRADAIERLGLPPERVVNIGCIVAPTFAPLPPDSPMVAYVRARFRLPSRFVLYSGGFDARKNVETLIAAYAKLPAALRSECPLVLAGHIRDERRREVVALAANAGLRGNEAIVTGSLADDELIGLYASCALFVFPSRLEGFGLPPAEAMACGAPTLASRATSIPEVVGREDTLFDPDDSAGLATRMQRVLVDPTFAEELRRYGPERVRRFRAENVAQATLDAFERQGPRAVSCVVAGPEASTAVGLDDVAVLPPWARLLDLNGAMSDLRFHVFDAASTERTFEGAVTEPGIVLLSAHEPVATEADRRVGTYLGGGYAALRAADSAKEHDPLAALVPMFQEAVGVVTQTVSLAGRVNILLRASGRAPLPVAAADDVPDVSQWLAASPVANETRLVRDIANLPGRGEEDDLAQIAYGACASRTSTTSRWFVDVTRIANGDLGTGVHRVVRSVLGSWLDSPPAGTRIEPVRFEDGEYRYARAYSTALMGLDTLPIAEGIVQPRQGDVFVGLDWAPESLAAAAARLADWRRGGVETCFIVHDLLPLRFPEYFHPYSCDLAERGLREMSFLADRVACVSKATARDYEAWLGEAKPRLQFERPPIVETFVLGVDPHVIGGGIQDLRESLRTAVAQRPTLLMVGTLEPRKGHRDALDAADRMWDAGVDFNLAIVGRRGWLVDDVVTRIERHSRRGSMLHWHDDISDRELGALYAHSTALLAASLGEGYGLPLIEAARHGLPVVARDIAVFREVMAADAEYLPDDPLQWDPVLRSTLAKGRRETGKRRWPTWAESAQALASAVCIGPIDD